jgi:hypothetical protein
LEPRLLYPLFKQLINRFTLRYSKIFLPRAYFAFAKEPVKLLHIPERAELGPLHGIEANLALNLIELFIAHTDTQELGDSFKLATSIELQILEFEK